MKQIIESIKSNREELISKYFEIKNECEVLSEGMKQVKKMGVNETRKEVYGELVLSNLQLRLQKNSILTAINNLTNALNHLGENTETFLG